MWPASLSSAALWGRDHVEFARIATASLGDAGGVALTRGRFPKQYDYVDPNEDAALVARRGDMLLLAVADGHNGADAAEAALEGSLRTFASCEPLRCRSARRVVGGSHCLPRQILHELGAAARGSVEDRLASVEDLARRNSRTALSLALVVDDRMHALSFGDTAVFLVRGRRVRRLTRRTPFLGPRTVVPSTTTVRLRQGDRLVVASDGCMDFLGRGLTNALLAACSHIEPVISAHELVQASCDAGAGDNVAVAATLHSSGRRRSWRTPRWL